MTSFIGREREIAEVRQLLAAFRLVTLTGPGGCGKTRLALQVVAKLVTEYSDGVWLIELAPVSDPALVPHKLASTLGVPLSAIAAGSNQSLATALLGDLTAGERRGRALGWMHTFGDLSSAIAPPRAYWILPWIGLPGIYLACAGLLAGMWMWAVQLAQVRLSPKTISL